MRHENSDFITKFITDAGDYKLNKDYFAYLELDDYACWVMADGIDSADDKLSSKLVVESIIHDFSERPSMKKRQIKKYIKNANQRLLTENKRNGLKSTVLVIVSDYKSFIWANVGNTRLYHFSKGRLKNKSKDHTLAQMMLEAGEIEAKKLNYHQERNNITQYLGQEKRLKINFSKKISLKDDDMLLLATVGFWENLLDEDIRITLNEAEDNLEFMESLENYILEEIEELDNYTFSSIFIEKVYQDQVKKSWFKDFFTKKKLALILVPLIILGSSYFTYNQIQKVRAEREAAIEKQNLRLDKIRETMSLEKQGDELANSGDYEDSLAKYQEAERAYETINNLEKKDEVKEKQLRIKEIIKGVDLEEQAKKEFKESNYETALDKYKAVESIYQEHNAQGLEKVEERIDKAEAIIEAGDYEAEGDIFYQAQNYLVAKEKYQLALNLYQKKSLRDKEQRMEENLATIDKKLEVNQAKEYEAEAEDFLEKKEFDAAIDSYQQAQEIYTTLEIKDKAYEMAEIIEDIDYLKIYQKAQNYEEIAEQLVDKREYQAGIENYQLAKKSYEEATAENEVSEMGKRIADVKDLIDYEQAESIEAKGDEKKEQEDYKEAIKNYQQAKEIYDQLERTEELARVNEKLEEIDKKKEMLEEADEKTEDDNSFFLFF